MTEKLTPQVNLVPIAGSFGSVRWLFSGSLTVQIRACWNEHKPGTHYELQRDGERVAVGTDEHLIDDQLSDGYELLSDNAKSHVRQILKRASESPLAVDDEIINFEIKEK